MTSEAAVAGFRPSTSGFHFANSWPVGTPALVLRTPFGRLRLGDASRGLCGGMVLAAADLFVAGQRPPPWTEAPSAGSPVLNHLTWRLLESWDLPTGPWRYLRWMGEPDAGSGSRPGLRRRTADELDGICSALEAGRLCPLGVVTVASRNPMKLGLNHQVLAYGYSRDEVAADVVLRVYDPNQPDDDAVEIRCDPTGARSPEGHLGIPHPVRGLFAIRWSPHDPPAPAPAPAADQPESGSPAAG
jgi:hypothetical protein